MSSGGWRNDGMLRLYDVSAAAPVAVLKGSAKGILGAAFRPDGRIIASSSLDGVIQLWGVE